MKNHIGCCTERAVSLDESRVDNLCTASIYCEFEYFRLICGIRCNYYVGQPICTDLIDDVYKKCKGVTITLPQPWPDQHCASINEILGTKAEFMRKQEAAGHRVCTQKECPNCMSKRQKRAAETFS